MSTDSSHSQPSGANTPWTPPSPEELGARLPAYEVTEILGRGGMGAVYKARQKSLKRWVAIKLLPLVAADDELKFAERFRNEAETMAQMNHPSIVNVYDFGETSDGLLYIVMEFVDGTDVQKMIHGSGLLSGDYALAITAHVCDALSYAHARGVIHRDIKPANILIDQEGNVKVADFGLAKMTDIDYGLTQSNVAMGTPDYVAPEVLSYGMVADHRADLYAIGVMLYQMLTGEVPRGLFKMPSQKGIGADPRFDDIICKAMEPDREDRYQSATDVRQALDVILTTALPKVEEVEESTSAAKSVRFQYAPPQRNAEVMEGETRSPAKAPPKRQAAGDGNRGARTPVRKTSSAGLWLGISGLVAVIGFAGFLILGGKSKSAPESASTKSTSSSQPGKVPPQTVPPRSEPATGKTIDLLPLIDVKRDAIAGEWERTAGGLVKKGGSTTTQGAPRLQLPYQPPEEYDYEIEFTPTAGTQTVGQMISAQSRMFSWIINGGRTGEPMSGFEMFDARPTSSPSEVSKRMDGDLVNGRRYRSRVEVRASSLRGFLDDKEIVNWSGKLQRLTLDAPSRLRDDDHLGLRAVRETTFHKITVREITGTGNVDAGVATTSSVSANTIDLLPLVDPGCDAVVGKWSQSANGLSVAAGDQTTTGKGSLRLQLPYQPPEEYDFEIEFTASAATGRMLGQILSASARNFSLLWAAGAESQPLAGFEMLDGLSTGRQTNTTKPLPGGIESGRRYRSRVEVRRDSVRAFLNDKEVVSWKGSFGSLSIDEQTRLRDELHLGLRTSRPVTYHKITVREITGTGKVDAGTATTSSSATAKTIDLLPIVDVKRDMIGGEWSREGGDLVVKAAKPDTNGTPRLQLPYQPPEEYDFEIEFTPESGTNMVGQALSAYQHSFSWFLDGKTKAGSKAGFDAIDGISVASRTDGTMMRSNFLTNGQRHRSTVEVRRNGVRALLNGEPLVTWGSSPKSYERLDISKNEKMRDALHLGLAAYDRTVRFHKITVREITGTGKMDAATSNDAPPVITNWQDVTESVREMARGTSGLSVENDGTIRHSSEGRFPKLTLTKTDQRDNAVRVHYTGEVQIGLRSNTKNTDFLFVLCEANQTIFAKFHGDKAEKSEKVGLTKTHPSVFEADREHELLVTMQGTRFRAWMDGVFWGEGNDDTLTEGTAVLLFTPKMVVKKVEISELAASPADAAASVRTFQGHRYQFVPGSYTWTEAKSEAEELGGHLAVITSAEEDEWAWKTFSGPRPQVPKEELWMHGWWLGASQSPQEKAWQWLTAEAMTFTGWRPGEPRATIQPPRGLWMSDDADDALDSKWTAQKMSWKGGFLVEWESTVAAQTVAVAAPWTDRLGTMKWETPWSLKEGALSTSAPTTMQELGQVGDGALRIRARLAAGTDKGQFRGPTLQPALRIGPVKGATDRQGSYQFQAYFPGGACSLVYLERDLKTGTDLPPEYLWKNSALPPDLRGKEEIEWEFRAIGDELSAWADGQFVASARDARVSAGRSKLTAFPGIEITSVETSGIKANTPAAANQNDLPNIANWQDVTASVREKAKSNPQLVVEPDRIRHVGQGSTPTLPLTKDSLRDYAVRLRFSGDAQVNLRTNPTGFLYVLCQGKQTIFQRYEKNKEVPTVLIPSLQHPGDYDSSSPHEFLVTMQGPTIRAWLDGRFIGEAHDDTFEEGTAGIALTKHSIVQKVEIAELESSPAVASTDWQPLFTQPEDFGADASKAELRDGWLFVNTAKTHYAPTDSIDGAIRATVRFHPQHTANLTARANDGAPWGKEAYACSVFITPDGKTATLMATMEKIDGEKPWKRHDFPLPAPLREGEEFTLELRVNGNQIAVLTNGKELGSATLPFPETKRRFGIMTSTTGVSEFRDVAWQKLE